MYWRLENTDWRMASAVSLSWDSAWEAKKVACAAIACLAAKQRVKASWERASIRARVRKAGRGWAHALGRKVLVVGIGVTVVSSKARSSSWLAQAMKSKEDGTVMIGLPGILWKAAAGTFIGIAL